jgi:hypothetical protein
MNNIELTQLYKFIGEVDPAMATAQYVYKKNTDVLVGFVAEINDDRTECIFCLFEPQELPKNAINISKSLSDNEVKSIFLKALANNPDAAELWDFIEDCDCDDHRLLIEI